MELTRSAKRDLVARYMPILLMRATDIGPPLDPEVYVAQCALWSGSRPGLDDKVHWGIAAAGGRRTPHVARGSMGVDLLPLAETPGDVRQSVDEYWLDCAGWRADAEVGPATDNRQADPERLRTIFAASDAVVRAEVCDGAAWAALADAGIAEPLLGLTGTELSELLGRWALINYQMLFASHRGPAEGIFPDGTRYGAEDHEGSWVCFSILLSAPAPDAALLEPRFAIFERRFRGKSRSLGENRIQRQFEAIAWNDVPRLASSVAVLAADGTHNLYPATVPASPSGTIAIQSSGGFADNVTDDVAAWVEEATEENWHTAAAVLGVTLAKMAAGAAIAGPIGAVGGLIAGVAEAGPIAEEIGHDPGPIEIDPSTTNPPEGELEEPEEETDGGLGTESIQIVAAGTIDTEAIEALLGTSPVDIRHIWAPRAFEPVDRSAERFWPTYAGAHSSGYLGRWGVRCAEDPFNRRAGDLLPDYRVEVLRSVLHLLAQ